MGMGRIVAISGEGLGFRSVPGPREAAQFDLVHWSSILAVDVFKRDLWSYDRICLQLVLDDAVVEFDEDDPRWSELTDRMAKFLPGCRPWGDWFSEVAFPAFESCHQRIYGRRAPAAGDAG